MDCMELLSEIPEGYVSLILTDPPYGICYQNQFTRHRHAHIVGDVGIDYERFVRECYRILKDNCHGYFFTRFDCYPYHFECLRRAGFIVKNCLVIEKGTLGGIGDLYGSYANNAEWVLFCQKGRRVFNQTTLLRNRKKAGIGNRPGKPYKTRHNACWFGEEYPKATYNSNWQKRNGIYHPAIKNAECLSWLIQISSRPGEIVFDGFMGTGSTAVAAVHTGRAYLGAEIVPEYFAIARKRILEAEEGSMSGGEGNHGYIPKPGGDVGKGPGFDTEV